MTTGVISTIEEGLLDQLRALREPMDYIDKALRDDRNEIRTALRELRGELAGIRTRLDGLVGIEQQLRYQSQRIGAVEKRFATLVETKLEPADLDRLMAIDKGLDDMGQRLADIATRIEAKLVSVSPWPSP
jgi:uncharacterized coiled-coil DUF342 family protein